MSEIRQDWTVAEISEMMARPLLDLLLEAQTIHRQHFKKNEVQLSTLLSIKTGACPEDCSYCTQSGHHNTNLKNEKLFEIEPVLEAAKKAKESGATRFCMGAAWRSPPKKAMPQLMEMVREVKALGLETCMTLGMLDDDDSEALKEAGLDYYNHNIDTSRDYYEKVTTTRKFDDRLDTLEKVRKAGINVCSGGIMGLGESREDRVKFIHQLATLPEHPQSVPMNQLVPFKGTPLAEQKVIEWHEFLRAVACARITMPKSYVRLSAGRTTMGEPVQALCFMAGANSVHLGEKLLTCDNVSESDDFKMLEAMGLVPEVA